ncbi:cobalt-precorrin-5B (C(1))-methyltransferase [bacterium]|nr:MAG: cobalt-precorrin-5B (C(1))-methyltransferase [bacterium]
MSGEIEGYDEEEDLLLPPPRKEGGLRTGYTTGACAAAAAKAATMALIEQKPQSEVSIWLPTKREAVFKTVRWHLTSEEARCCVIKDAGDDPDVTHGARICAVVCWRNEPGIEIARGEGVGLVTKPGLGLEIGAPAITRVPWRLITSSVKEAAGSSLESRGIRVTLFVPGGEEIAQKTLNPRLGIVGGISILGATGIVRPYSTAAWRATVVQNIFVAAANGCREIVLSTGGQSETFARKLRPDLPDLAFVDMGIFTGEALRACLRKKVERVVLCGMIGKFSKLAQGHLQTHAVGHRVDLGFLASVAAECGLPEAVYKEIATANTARHFAEIARAHGLERVFSVICDRVAEVCFAHVKGGLVVEATLFDFEGTVLGKAQRVLSG